MVQLDSNPLIKTTANNSPPQSSGFPNSFVKYTKPANTNPALMPTGQHNELSSPSLSPSSTPRNSPNPNLHAFPNSFKHYAASETNCRSTLHPSKSYSELPVSFLDQSPQIEPRKSTPLNMEELQFSLDLDSSSIDCSCAANFSSSSSSSPPSSESSDGKPPKRSYLDATVSSNKQELVIRPSLPNGFSETGWSNSPPTSPSSSTGISSSQSQPSKSPISDRSTAPLASVSFGHSDSLSRLSRTRTIGKRLSVSTSYTTTTIALSASNPRVSVSVEAVAPSPKDGLMITEGLDPMSGHVLGICQSCNNSLKHCCKMTLVDILSRSRSL